MPYQNVQLHDIDSLHEISKELGRMKISLDLEIKNMQEDGVESLELKNNTLKERGLRGLGVFIDGIRDTRINARISRGKYSAEKKRKR